MLDSQSSGPGFESRFNHYLDLSLGSPEFKSSATLVNSQLVCLRPARILNNIMFNLIVCFSCLLGPTSTSLELRAMNTLTLFKCQWI